MASRVLEITHLPWQVAGVHVAESGAARRWPRHASSISAEVLAGILHPVILMKRGDVPRNSG